MDDLRKYDPYGIDRDAPLHKFAHHFQEKQRVRLTGEHAGRTGEITSITNSGRLNVMLSSGHHVECERDEAEPADFPSALSASEKAFAKRYSPFPDFDESEEQLDSTSRDILTKAGLSLAFEAGTVTAHDRVLIKTATENIANHRTVVSPLPIDDEEEENHRTLRIMSEKYAGTSRNTGPLHKAAGGGDRVDDLIRGAVDGLRAGHNVVLPPECRIPFLREPFLRDLVAKGRICFDYAG